MTRLYWCDEEELELLFRLFSETRTHLATEELWRRYEKRFTAQARSWVGGNEEMANDALGELKIRLLSKDVQRGFNPLGRGNGWQRWASAILYHEVLQLFRRRRTIRWEMTKTALGQLESHGVPKDVVHKLKQLLRVTFYDEGSLQNDVHHLLGSSFADYWPMIREVAKRGVNVAPLSDANLASLQYENDQAPDGAEQLRELGTVMVECLNELDEDERDVLLLWVLTGLTYNEIAARLGLTLGVVVSRSSTAREKMQRSLRQRDSDIAG